MQQKDNSQDLNSTTFTKKVSRHWRLISLLSLALVSGLTFALVSVINQKKEIQTQQALLENKLQNLNQEVSEIEPSVVLDKVSTINEKLDFINKYLKERGLSSKEITATLDLTDSEQNSKDLIANYGDYLDQLTYEFTHIPLGLPVKGKVSSLFGYRPDPFNGAVREGHSGMDIKAPKGTPVKIMAKGKVVFAGQQSGYGNCIIVQHANGLETLYGHLSRILVKNGDHLDIGQVIGKVGSTGRSTGPHLHYEIRKNGVRINPAPYLSLEKRSIKEGVQLY